MRMQGFNAIFAVASIPFVKLYYTELKKQMDYNEYGGAPIMGVSKPVFKAHGDSKAKTFKNALRLTKAYVEGNVAQEISRSVAALKAGSGENEE